MKRSRWGVLFLGMWLVAAFGYAEDAPAAPAGEADPVSISHDELAPFRMPTHVLESNALNDYHTLEQPSSDIQKDTHRFLYDNQHVAPSTKTKTN